MLLFAAFFIQLRKQAPQAAQSHAAEPGFDSWQPASSASWQTPFPIQASVSLSVNSGHGVLGGSVIQGWPGEGSQAPTGLWGLEDARSS